MLNIKIYFAADHCKILQWWYYYNLQLVGVTDYIANILKTRF